MGKQWEELALLPFACSLLLGMCVNELDPQWLHPNQAKVLCLGLPMFRRL